MLNFVLPLGGGLARNTFRGLRLQKILNNVPGFLYPEEVSPTRQLLKYLMTSSALTLNLPCSLSTSRKPFWATGRGLGLPPRHTTPSVFIFPHRVLTPGLRDSSMPWVGAHEVPTGSVTTPCFMADAWTSAHLSPPVLHHPSGWGSWDGVLVCLLTQPQDNQGPIGLSVAGVWNRAEAESLRPSAW